MTAKPNRPPGSSSPRARSSTAGGACPGPSADSAATAVGAKASSAVIAVGGRVGQVGDQVALVDPGPVALGGDLRLRLDIDPEDALDAAARELIAAEPVAGAEVEHAFYTRCLEGVRQHADDDAGRAHPECFVEDPFVEAGHRVDRGVVVKADPATGTGRAELDPLLGRGRQRDRVEFGHRAVASRL